MRSGFIAIAGRPNVGKSTLLNRVLGSELSIVTPKAQTTRERVLGILTQKNRGQIVFIDTPGIHRARPGGLNAYMVDQARRALEDASILWVMVDPKSELEHEQVVLDLLAKAHAGSKQERPKVYLLLNKADLPLVARGWTEPKVWTDVRTALGKAGLGPDREFTISALTGAGVPELVEGTWSDLSEGPQYYNDEDQLSDRPLRYFVAEKVREQLYLQLGEEIPYSCAVEITAFNESAKPLRIEANIHVERDSQKGMVIGKGGTKLKAIGTAARQKIEAFLDARVYLGLTVRVSRDWSQELKQLERLGYSRPEGTKEKSS